MSNTPCNENVTLQPSKILCIGRNYADHAKELNNPIPDEPVVFMKPGSCAVDLSAENVSISNEIDTHYEVEMVVEVEEKLSNITADRALNAISRVGIGLDLTRRSVQNELKVKGYPWERAKAFDASAPISELIRVPKGQGKNKQAPTDWQRFAISLHINEVCVQFGKTEDMLFGIADLLVDISKTFTLFPGDLVMTGTPAGVGKLNLNDNLRLCLHYQDRKLIQCESKVVSLNSDLPHE